MKKMVVLSLSLDHICQVKYTDRDLEDKKSVLANPGDLVIWDSRLWHGARENKSKKDRWSLIATLTQWWVKQAMDIPKSLPQSIFTQCTDRQRYCSVFALSRLKMHMKE